MGTVGSELCPVAVDGRALARFTPAAFRFLPRPAEWHDAPKT